MAKKNRQQKSTKWHALKAAFAKTANGQQIIARATKVNERFDELQSLVYQALVLNAPGYARHALRKEGINLNRLYMKTWGGIKKLAAGPDEDFEATKSLVKFTYTSRESFDETLRVLGVQR